LNGRIFAWSKINSLFLSTNDGSTWTITSLQTTGVNSIFINSSNFIFTGGDWGNVYLSTDHGNTWSLKNNGIYYNDDLITIAENSESKIFAGAKCDLLSGDGGGVYKTTDNGNNWSLIGLLNRDVYSLAINSSGDIFAAHSMGISKSTDGGNNWFNINNGLLQYDVIKAIAVAPNGNLFAGSWEWGGGMYRSTNGGQNWVQINSGLPSDNVSSLIIKSNGYIFTGYENSSLFRSTNNGDSWTDVGYSLNPDISALDLNQSGHIYASSGTGGIYKSVSNGEFWDKITNGIINLYITALANNLNGDILAGTDGGGLYLSTDQGLNWMHINISYYEDYTIHDFITIQQGDIFAALGVYVYPVVARSTNGGYSWSSASNGIIDDAIQCLYEDHNGFLYAGGFQKVYISTNNGGHWNYVTNGITNRWVFAVAVNQSNHIFAGTYGGGMYRSTNYGNTFVAINNGIEDYWIYSLALDSFGNIFAGNRAGIYRSTNNGDNWIHLTNGINNPGTVHALITDKDQNIFAGADEGLYFSSDDGNSWILIDDGLQGNFIISLSIDSLGQIYAGTYDGVFKLVNEIPVIVVGVQVVSEFSLSQNYPNPFNPVTKIKYSIPSVTLRQAQSDIIVTLKVYDILGREVSILVNEEKPAGEYEVDFNAANLPSGIYFYQINAGGYSETKKMVLLK
jgi:photosystem II stability/assembly factor-like uncharacterized protein